MILQSVLLVVLTNLVAAIDADFAVTDADAGLPDSQGIYVLKMINGIIGQNFVRRFVMVNFNYYVAHHLF